MRARFYTIQARPLQRHPSYSPDAQEHRKLLIGTFRVSGTGLEQGIGQVWRTCGAFLAQLTSGKITAWGCGGNCGDITGVK